MTSSTRVTVASLTAALLLLMAGSPAPAQAVWGVVPSPNEPGNNVLHGADASDASHVWAVGRLFRQNPLAWHSLILRFDGTQWRPASRTGFPAGDELHDVDAVAADDAWAVGNHSGGFSGRSTLVARWDGATWRPEPSPNGTPDGSNQLAGVTAVPNAAGSVWAVGSYAAPGSSGTRRSLVLQRTGGTWRTSPAPRLAVNEVLEGVDATGPNDAWAVGWGGAAAFAADVAIALHWDGTSWRSVPVPTTGPTMLRAVEALAPNNVWAVGETNSGSGQWVPFVAQFNGTSWRRLAVPALNSGGRLNDVVALSASNVYAVGSAEDATTLVLHWNGASWIREATPSQAGRPILTGAAAVGPGTVWAVGYRFELNAYADRTLTMHATE
jgi:hypothetical protein